MWETEWIQQQYWVGERINIQIWDKTTPSIQLEGPFTIVATRTNGTLNFQQTPTVVENIWIGKIKQYKGQ